MVANDSFGTSDVPNESFATPLRASGAGFAVAAEADEERHRAGCQPPTWMPGLRAGSGSLLRMISRTTGGVSPRPRMR